MSDTENTQTAKGFEMPLSFIDRMHAAGTTAEAGDVFIEARSALDRDGAEWRLVLAEMTRRIDTEPVRPIEPLIVFG